MDAVQRMRRKAQGTGALRSKEQLRVESSVVQEKTIIVIEQANPGGGPCTRLRSGLNLSDANV